MRKYDKKYNIVYMTENIINGKIYVGVHKTDNIDDGYLGSGLLLQKAIKKYGKENFNRTILKFCDTYTEALALEKEIVNLEFTKDVSNYNIAVGGCHWIYPSGSYIERISKAQTLRYSNKEARLKISRSLKEKWKNDPEFVKKMMKMLRSELRCTKISKAHKKWIKDNPDLHTARMMKINTNPEKIEKMAETHRGMKRSDESKERMSKARTTKFEKMTGEEYDKHCGKNQIYIHNITTNKIKRWKKKDKIPKGWAKGSGSKPSDFADKQKAWRKSSIIAYHKNTYKVLHFKSEETVPDDYIIGERPYELSPEYRVKLKRESEKVIKFPNGFVIITQDETGKKKRHDKTLDIPTGWSTDAIRKARKKAQKRKWKPGERIRIHNIDLNKEMLHPKNEEIPKGWNEGSLVNRVKEYYGRCEKI